MAARGKRWRCAMLAVAAGICLLPGALQAGQRVGTAALRRRMDALARSIRATQAEDGSLGAGGRREWAVGQTALGLLALRAGGAAADDPAVRAAARYLAGAEAAGEERGVYQVSLKMMALASVDARRYRDQIAAGARYLARAQQGSGGWSYTQRGPTDNSNSQFALLGLNAAARSGVDVPVEVWSAARRYYAAGQNGDGSWGYRASGDGDPRGSMTAAGVASLYLCDLWIHVQDGRCGVYADDRRIQAGLTWLANHFSVTHNPGFGMWKFYYLYALERVGVILARAEFGGRDWYREGVDHLVGDPNGRVRAAARFEWPFVQNCFMLLFLGKGNAPILLHKARWGGGWNTNRYDARFLVLQVSRLLGQKVDYQVLPLSAPLRRLMRAPILYVSGAGMPRWGPGELERLKQYLEAGGVVVAEPANGDANFDRAFRAMLRRRMPDRELVKLPKDHPVYTAHFEIPPGRRPPLEAFEGPCWTSLIYAPGGLSCEWDTAEVNHVNFKMGVNIVAYLTDMERLEGKLVEPSFYVPSQGDEQPQRRGAFTLGQLVHPGNWRPHKVAWRKVLTRVNREAGLPVYSRPVPIRVDVESPFQAQMIYLTGVKELRLNAEARSALKLYLQRGGFIFAEAACGSRKFDRSFRRLMEQMFPERELQTLPVGHPLYEAGAPMEEVVYSPLVRRKNPDLQRPSLEFIEQDGRAAVVYSKYDLSSAIDGHPCHQCPAVMEPSASKLAVKIILYGLSS